MQVGLLLRVRHAGGPAGGPNIRIIGQRLDHRKDGAVFQERKFASPEVIQQRTEGFGSHGNLRVQPPRAIGIELALLARRRYGAHDQ
jgi:hypothetical protein